jgi:hypothetical protein
VIPTHSLKEVSIAWNIFNSLHAPEKSSPAIHYKQRNEAWKSYAKIRDHFLYGIGKLSLHELNCVWYPKMIQDAYSPRSIHKN